MVKTRANCSNPSCANKLKGRQQSFCSRQCAISLRQVHVRPLNADVVRKIRSSWNMGASMTDLAYSYNTTVCTVSKIVHRQHYKDVV